MIYAVRCVVHESPGILSPWLSVRSWQPIQRTLVAASSIILLFALAGMADAPGAEQAKRQGKLGRRLVGVSCICSRVAQHGGDGKTDRRGGAGQARPDPADRRVHAERAGSASREEKAAQADPLPRVRTDHAFLVPQGKSTSRVHHCRLLSPGGRRAGPIQQRGAARPAGKAGRAITTRRFPPSARWRRAFFPAAALLPSTPISAASAR